MYQPCRLLMASLLLAACSANDGIPNFERMTELELAEYNSGRPLDQMIVCSDQDRSFSRVRRRHCATVEQMYGSAAQAAQLEVLNTIPGFSGDN